MNLWYNHSSGTKKNKLPFLLPQLGNQEKNFRFCFRRAETKKKTSIFAAAARELIKIPFGGVYLKYVCNMHQNPCILHGKKHSKYRKFN